MILGYLCSKKECHSGNAPRQYVKGLEIEGGNDQMNPYQVPSSRAKCVNNIVNSRLPRKWKCETQRPVSILKIYIQEKYTFYKTKTNSELTNS